MLDKVPYSYERAAKPLSHATREAQLIKVDGRITFRNVQALSLGNLDIREHLRLRSNAPQALGRASVAGKAIQGNNTHLGENIDASNVIVVPGPDASQVRMDEHLG